MVYEPIIGFEVHCELKTNTKVWCGCSTQFGAEQNTNVCPVCLGMPGSLPVLNREAMEISLRVAAALQADFPEKCYFDRKNYYYPDLPKNYQISQQYEPLGRGGFIEIDLGDGKTKKISMDNIHLEEDAGKNIHPESAVHVDYSLVDLNRAGTPLLEIVSNPEIETKEEAEAFMKGMKSFLEYLDASECKMEEGRLRFELNISLREKGSDKLGQKVEIKNLNSMSVVMKCIDAEIERQTEMLEDGKRIAQETRLWDEVKRETRSMRSKETAHDYRYFPDPDLVDIELKKEWLDEIRNTLPELPLARKARFISEYSLTDYDATVLTAKKDVADFFETAVEAHNNPKAIANWITTEVLRVLNDLGEDASTNSLKFTGTQLGEMVALIDKSTITGKIAKQVFPIMADTGKSPEQIVEEKGLRPLDASALEPILKEILSKNPAIVEDIQAGKMKAIGGLMGQVMKATQGKANPKEVQPMIMKLINEGNA